MIQPNSFLAKVFSVLFSLVLLGALEAGARLIEPRPDRLDDILAVLRPDPSLIWKVREHLDVPFQGKRVRTDARGFRNAEVGRKEPGTLRIVCLGESLTFGWGVDEKETYPRVLEGLLRERAGARIEVINAGQIGYSSFQGLRLFDRVVTPLEPDIITVPYVINDVDRFRFFRSDGRSDRELEPGKPSAVQIENVLRHSALFRVMMKEATRLRADRSGLPRGAVRVSERDYEDNLRALVRAARQRGITVIFLKMPVNLPVMPGLPVSVREEAAALQSRGEAQLAGGDTAGALVTLKKAAELDPYDGDTFAALGSAYAAGKDRASARRSWERAKDCEAYRCRERGDRYNGIMERVAASESVPLVDVVSLYARYAARHGVYLFNDPKNDPIHPTPLGHRLIAGELADLIGERFAARPKSRS